MLKHEFLNKTMNFICCLLIGVLFLNIFAPMVYAASKSDPELVIEVYVNNFGIDYLENIVLDDGTKVGDYDYVVKNVPARRINTSLANYFDYAAWITRDEGYISLSLDPKDNVRQNRADATVAWNALSSPTGFGGSTYWQNTQVMEWQFFCHFDFAKNKDTWNIEPHRVASSYLAVVWGQCNPD